MIRRLGVNVDHVATLRQARRARYPDPLAAALIAERAGADQITVHLRGDRRHIQDHDLARISGSLQTFLNVEVAATAEMRDILLSLRPGRVTLVPERPGEVTTEGGLDVAGNSQAIAAFASVMVGAGVRVSVFIDPSVEQVAASAMPGIDMIELCTATYAETGTRAELARLARATAEARERGLGVAAGHGLNLHNLRALVVAVPEIEEYNIGHALIGDAIFLGLEASVRAYKTLL